MPQGGLLIAMEACDEAGLRRGQDRHGPRLACPLRCEQGTIRSGAVVVVGVPAMLYGAAVSRPTAAALRAARTASPVARAFARYTRGSLLAVPWRADPAAAVAIGLLWRLVLVGAASGEAIFEALLRSPRAGGLLAAAASRLRDGGP